MYRRQRRPDHARACARGTADSRMGYRRAAMVMAVVSGATLLLWDHAEADVDARGYCETGFGKVDTDGDGVVSPDEVGDALAARFESIDANDDGVASRQEYRDCLSSISQAMLENHSFLKDDVENSVRSGADAEATRKASAASTPEAEPADGGSGKAADHDLASFEKMDADDDGMVSQHEYLETVEKLYREPMSTEEEGDDEKVAAGARATFELFDDDGDGTLPFDEWKVTQLKRPASERLADRRYDALDTDANEELSGEEYRQSQQSSLDDGMRRSGSSGDEGVPLFIFYRYVN